MPGDRAGRIGSLAVGKGLMSPEELNAALEEFDRRAEAGSQVPLGELLVEMGHISRVQLESLLAAQGGKRGPGQQIAGYELIKRLGEGAMGAVYLARQLSMDRLVALKVLRRNLARNREFVERFIREARLAGKLDHVNIVHALDVGESGGFHYLAMEYVQGRTLSSLPPPGSPMNQRRALEIVTQVARALDYAHRHGIIHRDVKPENVLVTAEGVAKLTDMGLAKQTGTESHMTQDGTMVGTPHYVSPEQARGEKNVDARADIYSLGATLYRLVTGQTPYSGPTAAVVMSMHLTEPVPRAADANPEVGEGICRLIEKMMAKDPADRYPTAEALIADLELVAGGERPAAARAAGRRVRGGTTRATRPVQPVGDRRLRAALMAGAGAAALLLAVAATWALTGGGGGEEAAPTGAESGPPVGTSGPETPGPGPAPDEKTFEEMLAYAREYRRKHPEEYAEAIAKFEQVRSAARGNVAAMKAADAVAEVEKARAAAAAAALAGLKEGARKREEAGDFDAALKLLAAPPLKFANLLAAEVKLAADGTRGRAELRLKTAADAAAALSAAGEPEKALAELEKLAGVRYAAWAERLAALRARLEKQRAEVAANAEKKRLAAAEKRLEEVLEGFDGLAMAGERAEAALHLAAGRKKLGADVPAGIAARLAAAEKVAAELVAAGKARADALAALKNRQETLRRRDGGSLKGTITGVRGEVLRVRIRFKAGAGWGSRTVDVPLSELAPGEVARLLPERKPAGEDGQVAAAISAMAGKRFAAAARALAAAGEHPLAARYTRVMKRLRDGAAELAAEDAWVADIVPLAGGKCTVGEARKLLAALDAYAAAHGKSRFAAGHRPEADRLRALAEKAIEDSPEGMTAKVRKLFRGKTLSFDPGTLRIELLYDFGDGAQLADWSLESIGYPGKVGDPIEVRAGELHLPAGKGYATLRARFVSAEAGADFAALEGAGNAAVLACADGGGSFYEMTALSRGRNAFLARMADKRAALLSKVKPSPFRTARKGRVSLSFEAGRLEGRAGELVMKGEDKVLAAGRVGLHAQDTRATFDNFRVAGRLDRAWLDRELKGLAAREAPPSVFRAAWRRLEPAGEKPPRRNGIGTSMTYDSKRKRCVFFGGYTNRHAWNDIWWLDHEARAWRCLQADYQEGPALEKTRPRGTSTPYFVYDPKADTCWLLGHNGPYWGWRPGSGPGSGTWAPCEKAPHYYGSSYALNGWAYHPGTGSFLRVTSSGYTFIVRPPANKHEKVVRCVLPGSIYIDGGLAYDPSAGRFVLYGGRDTLKGPVDYTWTFDLSTRTWQRMRPEASPPARGRHRLVWHGGINAMVLTGPGAGKDGPERRDLWVYETAANRWTEVKTPTGPPPGGAAAAYDREENCLVLFTARSETWLLDIKLEPQAVGPGR